MSEIDEFEKAYAEEQAEFETMFASEQPAKPLLSMQERINQAKVEAFKKDSPVYSAIWPDAATAIAEERNEWEQAGAVMSNTFSLGGRLLRSIQSFKGGKETFEENLKDYLAEVGRTEGEGALDGILRSPELGAALFMAPLLAASGLSATGAGLAEGMSIGGVTQAGNIGKGEGFKSDEASLDVAISTLLPGISQVAGPPIKKAIQSTAKKIMESVIKPGEKLSQGVVPFDVEHIFEMGLDSPKGIGALQDNIKKEMGSINESYGLALKNISSSSKVNVDQALNNAKEKLSKEIGKGLHAADFKGIEKGLDYWSNYLKLDKIGGQVSPQKALAIRKGAGKLAKYDKINPNVVKGEDKAAQYFRDEINKQLDIYPDIRKLDRRLSKLYPIDAAVDKAVPRIKKNFIQSLTDTPALTAMALGGGFGAAGGGSMAGGPGAFGGGLAGMAAPLGVLALGKAMKSPGLASAASRGAGLAGDIMSNQILQRTLPILSRQGLQQQILGEQ